MMKSTGSRLIATTASAIALAAALFAAGCSGSQTADDAAASGPSEQDVAVEAQEAADQALALLEENTPYNRHVAYELVKG